MVWFVVGVISFSITLFAFIICLTLWVYHDAKIKSKHSPLIWALIVVAVPNFMGLITYLLVGRTNKHGFVPAKYKWFAIISAIFFMCGTGMLVFGTFHFSKMDIYGTYSARQIGSFENLSDNTRNGVWQISANRANGYSRITPILNTNELENFYVESNGTGNILIRFEQAGREETVNLSGGFNGRIDLSHFSPGKIIITIEFENSQNVNISNHWS